jgi:tetratricopeptide (TPR) repeat protein
LRDDALRFAAHFLLGHCYKHTDRLEEAKIEFLRAANLNRDDDGPLLELGNIAFRLKDFATAERYYRNVRDRGRMNSPKARWNLALLYNSTGRLEAARDELEALPMTSTHQFDRGQLSMAIDIGLEERAARERFKRRVVHFLLVGTALMLLAIIVVIYRRLQTNPEIPLGQRADLSAKLMTSLLSIFAALVGTIVGLSL